MRYYDITVTPVGGTTPFRRWTSHPNGIFDPGALNVEFDIPIVGYGTPMGGQSVTVEGVPLQDLLQAYQFGPQVVDGVQQPGMMFSMKGGMQAGLPLANPTQAGIITAGQIFQSFGNWEGTEMTLDFVLNPAQYSLDLPGNIVLNWTANTLLSQALRETLSVAYPDLPLSINISDQLVQNHDEIHFCSTLDQLAQVLTEITQGNFLGSSYPGVSITIQGGKLFVLDSTFTPNTVQLAFTDFVGQPTWIAPNVMQIKLVMRGDIQLGTTLKMPLGLQNNPGIVLTSASSMPSSLKYKSSFQGNFLVNELRQVGNYRSPDGASWVTIANCSVAES
jgi:hypothetical protein